MIGIENHALVPFTFVPIMSTNINKIIFIMYINVLYFNIISGFIFSMINIFFVLKNHFHVLGKNYYD